MKTGKNACKKEMKTEDHKSGKRSINNKQKTKNKKTSRNQLIKQTFLLVRKSALKRVKVS
jgi:hypothetical protein